MEEKEKKPKIKVWDDETDNKALLEAIYDVMPHKQPHGKKEDSWKLVEVKLERRFTARTAQDHFKTLSAQFKVNEQKRTTTGSAYQRSELDKLMASIRVKEESMDAAADEPDEKVIRFVVA